MTTCSDIQTIQMAFEQWNVECNQGYDLRANTSGKMQTYEHPNTEHAWRGFCHASLRSIQRTNSSTKL